MNKLLRFVMFLKLWGILDVSSVGSMVNCRGLFIKMDYSCWYEIFFILYFCLFL